MNCCTERPRPTPPPPQAPEVLLGHRYDSLADLWSVGTVLYQCLTGEPPYKVCVCVQMHVLLHVSHFTIEASVLRYIHTSSAAQASNPSALRKKYLKDDLVPVIPAYASHSLRNLLLRLLKKNPKERIVFSECACCGWPVQQKETGEWPFHVQPTNQCPLCSS